MRKPACRSMLIAVLLLLTGPGILLADVPTAQIFNSPTSEQMMLLRISSLLHSDSNQPAGASSSFLSMTQTTPANFSLDQTESNPAVRGFLLFSLISTIILLLYRRWHQFSRDENSTATHSTLRGRRSS